MKPRADHDRLAERQHESGISGRVLLSSVENSNGHQRCLPKDATSCISNATADDETDPGLR